MLGWVLDLRIGIFLGFVFALKNAKLFHRLSWINRLSEGVKGDLLRVSLLFFLCFFPLLVFFFDQLSDLIFSKTVINLVRLEEQLGACDLP